MNKLFTIVLVFASVLLISCGGGGGGGDGDSGPKITTNAPDSAVTQLSNVWAAAGALEDITGGFDVLEESKVSSSETPAVSSRLLVMRRMLSITKVSAPADSFDNGVISASWSFNNVTGYFEFTMEILANFTTDGITFQTGGTEDYTLTPYDGGCDWTYSADFTYVYGGTTHIISWNFSGTDTESESSMSGTFTLDGSTYNYSETESY